MLIAHVVRTVITTGQSSDTFTQLRALQQEEHSLQNDMQLLRSAGTTKTNQNALIQVQVNIDRIDQQIRQIQSGVAKKQETVNQQGAVNDHLTISRQAYLSYYNKF